MLAHALHGSVAAMCPVYVHRVCVVCASCGESFLRFVWTPGVGVLGAEGGCSVVVVVVLGEGGGVEREEA